MSKAHRRGPTQADVARVAGISQATVSYVLNNKQTVTVSDKTRQRILEAAQNLGYVFNNAARSLITNRTYTIASVIPDITNPFYPTLERGIQDVAETQGYDVIIYNSDGQRHKEEKALRSVRQARADGVIGVFFHMTVDDLMPLLELNIPVVCFAARPKTPEPLPLDYLYIDTAAAAQAAVTHLIGRGHRRIGMLARCERTEDARVLGYRQALAAHRIQFDPDRIRTCESTEEGGYIGMQGLLALATPPTAVFAANDIRAIGALLAIREAGLSVPEDVAIMGFDDIPAARLVSPALSTVTQFQNRLGQRAAELLLDRLNGNAPPQGRCEKMPYAVIVRESA